MRPLTLIRKVVSLMMFVVGRGGAVDTGTGADAVEVAVVTGSVDPNAATKEGINLQDLDGNHPRLTLFSPPYSVIKLKQAFGRVHRENSKSKSIQKIVYAAGTPEERVVELMGTKLENLTMINNGKITDEDLKI